MTETDITKHPLPLEPAAWFYGGEELHGPFDTKEDAAEEALGAGLGVVDNGDGTCTVYVAKCRRKQVNLAKYFNAERFLEESGERMDDNDEGSDEYGDQSPVLEVSNEDMAALEAAVRQAIWTWQRDRNLPLKSYLMDIIEEDVPVTVPLPAEVRPTAAADEPKQ